MIAKIREVLNTGRHLSLDVVLGGVIFSNALAFIFLVKLPSSVSFALGACIWLIYTLDHLIDARNVEKKASTKRHIYHQKYGKVIFIVFVIVAIIGLGTLLYLPYLVLIYGCILLGLVGLYFLTIWYFKIFFAKEIFIAILYGCGVFLGVLVMVRQVDQAFILFYIQTTILASINLLLFSLIEEQQDRRDGHNSWLIRFGVVRGKEHIRILFLLLSLSIGLGIILFYEQRTYILLQLIFVSMEFALWLIYSFKDWFQINERYRWLGDLVFLLPGLIFLL